MYARLRKMLSAALALTMLLTLLPAGGPRSAEGAPLGASALAEAAEPQPEPEAASGQGAAPSDPAPAPAAEPPAPEPPAATPSAEAGDAPAPTPPPAAEPVPESTPDPEVTPEATAAPEPEVPSAPEITPEAAPADEGLVAKAPPRATSVKVLWKDAPAASAQIDLGAADPSILLTARAEPYGGAAQQFNWTISPAKSKCVTLAPNGGECTVTGAAQGTVTVTATAADGSGKKASIQIKVVKRVVSVTILGPDGLAVGASARLSAQIDPADATDRVVAWSSGDKAALPVSAKGVATAKKLPSDPAARVVTITATARDGGIVGTRDIALYAPVTKVQIQRDGKAAAPLKLVLGDAAHPECAQARLTAALTPLNDTLQQADWTSSNKKVAVAVPDPDNPALGCLVAAAGPGSAVLTATARDGTGRKATLAISVTQLVEGLDIQGPATVTSGGSAALKAVVAPANASNRSVTWASSNPSFAKVSAKGVVTAASGLTEMRTVDITATAPGGIGIADTLSIAVLPRATGVEILSGGAPVSKEKVALGGDGKLQLAARVKPQGALQDVTWTTSNKKVAGVDQNGLVTAIRAGAAVITATAKDGSKKGFGCTVSVVRLADGVTIKGPTEVVTGDKKPLTASVTPPDASNKQVRWEIREGGSAATVENGVVKAGSVGEATDVTVVAIAADGSGVESAPFKITVRPKAASLDILEGDARPIHEVIYLKSSNKLSLSAEVLSPGATQRVTWAVPSSQKKLASVRSTGDLSCEVTGLTAGTVTLTATSADGAAQDSMTIAIRSAAKQDLALSLDAGPRSFYLDRSDVSGDWGSTSITGADLGDLEYGEWSLTLKEGDPDDLPVTLSLAGQSDTYAELRYSDLERAGTVTYTLSYAAGRGRYKPPSRDITLTVHEAVPEGAPDGISYPADPPQLKVGDSCTFDAGLIEFTGGALPDGADAWARIDLSDGMLSAANCALTYGEGTVTAKFKKAGRYVVTLLAGYSTFQYSLDLPVVVADGNKAPFSVSVNLTDKVLYAVESEDLWWDGSIGSAEIVGYDLGADESCKWVFERIDSYPTVPVDLDKEEMGGQSIPIDYEMGEGTGKVVYRATATAGGFSASADFTVEVKSASGLPEGVKVPNALPQAKPGGMLYLKYADIRFAKGSAPSGANLKKDYLYDPRYELSGSPVRVERRSDGVRFLFKEPGRYRLEAWMGFANYAAAQSIVVVVSEAEQSPLKLGVELESPVLYAGPGLAAAGSLGTVSAANYDLDYAAEEECRWTIARVGGAQGAAADPVAVSLGSDVTGEARNDLGYELKGGTGEVTYKVTAQTKDARGEIQFTVRVDSSGGLPASVEVSRYQFTAAPGGTLLFKNADIRFAGGAAPEGVGLKPDYNTDSLPESVVFTKSPGGVRCTFHRAGRYLIAPEIAIGNYTCRASQPIEILVRDADHPALTLSVRQHAATLYRGASASGLLADAGADTFQLDTAGGERCTWTLGRLSGAEDPADDPVQLTLDSSQTSTSASIRYALKEGSGTVRYRVTLQACGHSDSRTLTVAVQDGVPQGFPSGIRVPAKSYNIEQGDVLDFFLEDIQFASGAAPDGAEVWRRYETVGANWTDQNVDYAYDAGDLFCFFLEPGSYQLDAAIGIGNHEFSQRIAITVTEGGGDEEDDW